MPPSTSQRRGLRPPRARHGEATRRAEPRVHNHETCQRAETRGPAEEGARSSEETADGGAAGMRINENGHFEHPRTRDASQAAGGSWKADRLQGKHSMGGLRLGSTEEPVDLEKSQGKSEREKILEP